MVITHTLTCNSYNYLGLCNTASGHGPTRVILYGVLCMARMTRFGLKKLHNEQNNKETVMLGDDASLALTLKHDIRGELEIHSQRGTPCHRNLCHDLTHRVGHNHCVYTSCVEPLWSYWHLKCNMYVLKLETWALETSAWLFHITISLVILRTKVYENVDRNHWQTHVQLRTLSLMLCGGSSPQSETIT